MIDFFRALLPAGFFLAFAALALAAQPTGDFTFVFRDTGPRGAIDITVEAVAGSKCADRPCMLVIAMHGLTRNARATRDNWRDHAEAHDLIVVAPHFDRERFPTRLYQHGGLVGEPDRSRWIYPMIERLYDHLLAQKRAAAGGYILFGHSAGAQFAHRMALFMPEARMREVIVANAGFYTLPTGREEAGGHPYPYSLDETPATLADRRAVFGRKLHLMLGDQDNDPEHHQLNNSKGAKVQGPHRLARGRFFFAAAKREAVRLGTPFNWTETVVPGIDHDNRRMTDAAVGLLFRR